MRDQTIIDILDEARAWCEEFGPVWPVSVVDYLEHRFLGLPLAPGLSSLEEIREAKL